MPTKSHLEQRISAILAPKKHLTALRPSAMIVTVMLTLACVLAVACTDPRAASNSDKGVSSPAVSEPVLCDIVPEPIHMERPTYPREAIDAGLEGKVWISVFVDTSGNVPEALIKITSGHEILDNAALEAAMKNRFKPLMLDGKPVSTWVTYPVEFTLSADTPESYRAD